MKPSFVFAIVLSLAIIAVAGCGVPADVQQQLTSLQNQVNQLNTEKIKLTADKTDLEKKIADFEQQLASTTSALKDPSSSEAAAFMKQDSTDKDYPNNHPIAVAQIIDNARQKGIRAYYIIAKTKGSETYGQIAMNFIGFNTPDRGWVYFCTSGTCPDQESKIEIGKKLSTSNSWGAQGFDDTVISIYHMP